MITQKTNTDKTTDSRDSVVNTKVTSALQPDYSVTRRFIELFGNENTKQTFQIIPDSKAAKEENKGRILHGSIKQLWNQFVELNQQGYCISFVPNQTNLKGRKKTDITKYRTFFIDNDNGSPQSYHLKPSIIVRTSGTNSHSYWQFVEEINANNLTMEEYEQLNKRLVEHYDADLQANEVNKALRMPGFIYQKYDKKSGIQSEPSLVTFECNNILYDFNDLVENIESLPDKFDELLKEKTDWLLEEYSKDPKNNVGKLYQIAELLSRTAKELNNEDYLEIIRRELISLGELIDLDKDKCKCIVEDAINSGYFKNKGFAKTPTNQNNFSHSKKLSDVDLARTILESGTIDYLCDDYDDWYKVGMVCHAVDDSLFDDWDEWSSQSDRYQNDCAKYWKSFNSNGGLGIGSLIHWAEKGGWINPNKYKSNKKTSTKKQQRTKEIIEDNDEYFVENTIEDSIYKILFDEGKGNWSTINGTFYQYLVDKGYWNKQSEDNVLKLISEETRKFYSIDRRTGELNYKYFKNSNIDSSYNVCRKILALTQQVNNEHLISFINGTYNIKSRQLEPHQKQHSLTWGIDAEYRENNNCPTVFQDFITSSFGAEYIELIRAIISMYLDPTAPYGYFIHLIGKSGSGKGTLIKLLLSLFQQSCTTSINHFSELQSAEKRHQLLSGIRFCVAPDVNQYQGSISAFYELVDNGFYSGRPLYSSEAYSKQWNCKFLLASTQLLGIENAAEGWNRRCIPLQLKERTAKADINLAAKLKEAKADIISWALNINDEQRNNLLINACDFAPIKQLKAQQETFADSVKAFIDGCTNYDINATPLYDEELFSYYKEYCRYSGLKQKGLNTFRSGLTELLGEYRVAGRTKWNKELKKNDKIKAHWNSIKIIPALFIRVADNIQINENYLQEDNLTSFFENRTSEPEQMGVNQNCKNVLVRNETFAGQDFKENRTSELEQLTKVVKDEKLHKNVQKDTYEYDNLQKYIVCGSVPVQWFSFTENTDNDTRIDINIEKNIRTTTYDSSGSVPVQSGSVWFGGSEDNFNKDATFSIDKNDIAETTQDLWEEKINPSDDGSIPQFKIGDYIYYSGYSAFEKEKYAGRLEVSLIGGRQFKAKNLTGKETFWIRNVNDFELESTFFSK